MHIIPLHTRHIKAGDDLASLLASPGPIEPGDIVVVSSKVIAVAESASIHLAAIEASAPAGEWSKKCGRSPAFCQAVLAETERMHGRVAGHCPGALLTELKPDGLKRGSILVANAGLDESNVPAGWAVGWPKDPVRAVCDLRRRISSASRKQALAVIISDSCCRPRRLGVTAFALTVSGIHPLASQAGVPDMEGKPLRITTEAIADQLATAANFVMGNAGQSIPAAIIRGHGLTLSAYEGWVDGISAEEDLFHDVL